MTAISVRIRLSIVVGDSVKAAPEGRPWLPCVAHRQEAESASPGQYTSDSEQLIRSQPHLVTSIQSAAYLATSILVTRSSLSPQVARPEHASWFAASWPYSPCQ